MPPRSENILGSKLSPAFIEESQRDDFFIPPSDLDESIANHFYFFGDGSKMDGRSQRGMA